MRVNDGEGTITLSKKRVDQLKGWETVEKAYEEHTVVEGVIVEENRGGVVATAHGVRVFIPASQTGVPKDQPMSQLVKTKQSFYITEINRQRKRVVGSIRSRSRGRLARLLLSRSGTPSRSATSTTAPSSP